MPVPVNILFCLPASRIWIANDLHMSLKNLISIIFLIKLHHQLFALISCICTEYHVSNYEQLCLKSLKLLFIKHLYQVSSDRLSCFLSAFHSKRLGLCICRMTPRSRDLICLRYQSPSLLFNNFVIYVFLPFLWLINGRLGCLYVCL